MTGFELSGKFKQCSATVLANFAVVTYTIGIGWLSPNIEILQSENSPLSTGRLSDDEISWVSSIPGIGGIIGAIMYGWLADAVGRRRTVIAMGIPFILSWLFIAFVPTLNFLYIARFLLGISGGGCFVVVPIYVSEMVETKYRGFFGAFVMLAYNIGILLGYITGGYFHYTFVPLMSLVFPVCMIVGLIFFPETPIYLLSRNKVKEAKRSLKFLRGKITESDIDSETNRITKVAFQESSEDVSFACQDFTNKTALKSIVIALVLMSMTQFNGIYVILNYSSKIFRSVGSNLTPNASSVIIASIQIVGSLFAANVVERMGRKFLMVISCVGTGSGLFVTGLYLYLGQHGVDLTSVNWIPVISLSASVLFSSCGLSSLPYVIIGETCNQKIKGIILTWSCVWSWVLAFVMTKYFFVLTAVLSLYGCLWVFAGCCFSTMFFVIFAIPETKGISIDVILEKLGK